MLNNYHYLWALWNDKDLDYSSCQPGGLYVQLGCLSPRICPVRDHVDPVPFTICAWFLRAFVDAWQSDRTAWYDELGGTCSCTLAASPLTRSICWRTATGHYTEADCHPCLAPATVLLSVCGFNPHGIRLPHGWRAVLGEMFPSFSSARPETEEDVLRLTAGVPHCVGTLAYWYAFCCAAIDIAVLCKYWSGVPWIHISAGMGTSVNRQMH